jgi:hypothetical protein
MSAQLKPLYVVDNRQPGSRKFDNRSALLRMTEIKLPWDFHVEDCGEYLNIVADFQHNGRDGYVKAPIGIAVLNDAALDVQTLLTQSISMGIKNFPKRVTQ